MTKHELLWKEVTVLTLIAIFSLVFYNRADSPSTQIGFGLLSVVFYFITIAEEKKLKKNKKLHDYFHHTSSYFASSLLLFVLSYMILVFYNSSFIVITLAVGIILFSVGFMRLLFSKL